MDEVGEPAAEMKCPCCDGSGRVSTAPFLSALRARTSVTPEGCWVVPGAPGKTYPVVQWRGIRFSGHRLALLLWHGIEAPLARHRCDNTLCWNPAHIEPGTALENNQDRRRRAPVYGRSGERNHFAKVSDSQAAAIREEYRAGGDLLPRRRARVLAAELGVHLNTVYRIAVGRSHRSDTREPIPPRPHWTQR